METGLGLNLVESGVEKTIGEIKTGENSFIGIPSGKEILAS